MEDLACPDALHAEATQRMRDIRVADQADRAPGKYNGQAFLRDRERRVEVAGIYARGCLKTGQDFHDAALVFQHGNVPMHYRQAAMFAQEAVARGDTEAQWLVPRAVDRYLLNTGRMQLFGTNTRANRLRDSDGNMLDGYGPSCLPATVDASFDPVRVRYGEPTLAEVRAKLAERNAEHGGVTPTCEGNPVEPERGLFPGIW